MLKSHIGSFDTKIDRLFDRIRGNRLADRSFYAASDVADMGVIWILIGSVHGLTSGLGSWAGWRVIFGETTQSLLVNGAIKPRFNRSRPLQQLADDHSHPHPFRVPITSSFPSGHASAAFCAALLLSDKTKLSQIPGPLLWYPLAGFVASSRIHTKAHHASDVVAGAAVGLLIGTVIKSLLPIR